MKPKELSEIIGRNEDCRHQSVGLVHGDEASAHGMTASDLDIHYFRRFFEKHYGESLDAQEMPLDILLENMNLMKGGVLTVAGALLFAKVLEFPLPAFGIKCVSYRGLGNGVRRAIKDYPDIEFEDDRSGNIFKVVILRPVTR